jgi:hypothetical protein
VIDRAPAQGFAMKHATMIVTLITSASLGFAASGTAEAQRQAIQPTPDGSLPLCRVAEPGEQCRTRNGEIRVRRGRVSPADADTPETDNFGGGDVGFVTAPANGPQPTTNNLGGGDPGWQVRERPISEFGGDDVGFVVGGNSATAPAPEAMECESCDDDEDEPQGPIDNTPRPQEPTSEEPDDEEDCEWHNPAGGPDQEFCDE